MGEFDDPLGSLLVGSWLATVLYGMALAQALRYYKSYPDDPWQKKGLVVAALLLCLIAIFGDTANAYLPTVTYWGNPARLGSSWALPIYAVINTSVGVLVDMYLISRFYALSKNIFISLFLGLLVLSSLAGSMAASIILQVFTSLDQRYKAKTAGLVWCLTMTGADLSIALCLIWKLQEMRSSFEQTNSLIRRLCVGAIQTGSTTAMIALLLLITYLHNSASNIPTLFVYLLGPCYLHTLLYNLNLRHSSNNHPSGSRTVSSGGHHNNNIITDGIQVHRTAIVTMDTSESDQARKRAEEVTSQEAEMEMQTFGGHKGMASDYV